ncbi:MAG: transglutaminase-like domain-containing protein [Chloroflexi bacterium]|nr:transglutaminase-like domain-containing protein [Chloroflexota bacterium]
MDFVKQFTKELKRSTPAPEQLALAIAGLAYPQLDINQYLAQFDEMAQIVQQSLFSIPPGKARAMHFLHLINEELGFTGNRDNYYEPENSFLNIVLERRQGLPIMLSLVCMVIGRRINVDIAGIGFPGHFMARYQDEAGIWLLDPFNGAVLAPEDAADYLARIFSQPIKLPPDAYEAVSATVVAQRILNNLRGIYLNKRDFLMATRVMDYLLVLDPANALLWRDRGILHQSYENWEAAARDLRHYFFLTGQLMVAFEQEKMEESVAKPDPQDRQVIDIFRRIEETRRQIN